MSIASSGAEALSRIHGDWPELIISDCAMPGMTGVELSEHLRADPCTSQLPILLMSGSLLREAARGASFDAFLRKPFLAEHLLIEVRKLLAGISATPIHNLKA